ASRCRKTRLSQPLHRPGCRLRWGYRLGTAGDTAINGGVSRIDVVAVGGRAVGSGILGESFGIVASSIGRVRIAGTLRTPAAGSLSYPSGDNFAIHVL
ncbi:MAG: hypothetical protein ACKOTB_14825, partial [Planctomycetia bacterium]